MTEGRASALEEEGDQARDADDGAEPENAFADGNREAEELRRREARQRGAEGVEGNPEGHVDGAHQALAGAGAARKAEEVLPFVHDVHRIPYLPGVLNSYPF